MSNAGALDPLLPILISGSGGLVMGMLVGYAAKKALKVLAVIAGLFFAGLVILDYYGIVEIHYDALQNLVERLIAVLREQATAFISWFNTSVPFAAGFIAGFAIGFQKG